MPFNFALLNVEWRAQAVREVVDSLEVALPEGAWPNYVLGNQDESRLASRCGRDQARVAVMLLLTLRGAPRLYYGDEIGNDKRVYPIQPSAGPLAHRGEHGDGARSVPHADAVEYGTECRFLSAGDRRALAAPR
ncbi:MAG: alpha-amylase family glycosyl hydrolase [Anaerolineae bacterium]